MKKRTYLLLGAMSAGLMLAGIPAAAEEEQSTGAVLEEETDGEASAESEAEEDILQELIAPNTLDELVAKYGRVSYTITWFAADGTEDAWTVYQDETRYVNEDSDGIWIDDAGDVYGMDYEEDNAYRYLFVGDIYDVFRDEEEFLSHFTYNEYEQVVSAEVSDGLIYLETAIYYSDGYSSDDLVYYGYEEGAYDYELDEYIIDEETYELLELKAYLVSGEEKTLFVENVLNTEPEEFTVDEQLSEAIFGEDARTLSVVTDAGTDEEATYTQTVTKGSTIIVERSLEFDDYLYTDPECTEIAEEDSQYDILYLKRIDEE